MVTHIHSVNVSVGKSLSKILQFVAREAWSLYLICKYYLVGSDTEVGVVNCH
jgi:hypothetical protein